MSTFSGLNTAYTGLVAARKGLDVVGQNIANATTDGYTRQRVTTSSIGSPARVGMFTTPLTVGQGVTVDGIARLGDVFLDARVRSSAASSGYWAARANVMTSLESTLREPGENGLSNQLQEFWAGWQNVANKAGDPAPAGVLLEEAGVLVSQIAAGYREVEGLWTQVRSEVNGMVSELNDAGAQVADLNARIRSTLQAGGNINELLDKRSTLTTSIASLAGGTARELEDGTMEVLIGGNALVSGDIFRPVQVAGANTMSELNPAPPAPPQPVLLEWAHRPGSAVAMDGGNIGGALSTLAPAGIGPSAGTGGVLAEAAVSYNKFATDLATKVNLAHSGGFTAGGAAGGPFFALDPNNPATTLSVVPTDASEIAASDGTGALSGLNADKVAQLGTGPDSPNNTWSDFVTSLGVTTRSNLQQATLAGMATTSAVNMQLANASVDMDEENVNLLTFQVAYQGAARVLTAVDEMLDTLINRTGIVGR
ncbi:flagellar hook-associated protein FlgK [Diaminobutyricimonas sp. LJ205]|uniref:flagellar hook-associated protein FlgK n=1 Tax=Diaminobutyricimonas sp. LJ205 TaxID=2683590 RepID=UPI0012F4F892|nr:flagellar hook-associated protein FlgK [Diaminobutyricimonas sp. LJ205]